LEVRHEGVAVPLGTPKQRLVLALLLLNAGRAVSLESLIEELWSERPPASAVAHVRGYAGALRRLLTRLNPDAAIARAGSGYLVTADPDSIDLTAFERDVADGRAALASGDLPTALVALERARSRWRGRMLDGLARGPVLHARCTAVEQERAVVIDSLAEVHVRMGQPARAIVLLHGQVEADPLREEPYALLMRARYQLDGAAGALEVYDTARKVLAEELGLEPGAELQRLHRAVLNRAPELAPHGTRPAVAARSVPRELPAQAGCFVGRESEAAMVRAALATDDAVRHCPRTVVLYGPGGVGKSALAVRVAHDLADHYPDGQLYADLFGATPGLSPAPVVEVLGRMLRGIGVHPTEVPQDEADAVALWRTATADRRLLLVLDNAADVQQVAPLVPAAGTVGVLVTSRQPIPALDADVRVRLPGLPGVDGVDLLARVAGRRDADVDAAARIVELCDQLPLAIRIAAGRLASRPDLSTSEYADRLADDQRRLDELQLDGLAVRACVRSGYDALAGSTDPVAQRAARAFRALGLLKVPDVAPGVVAAMLDERDVDAARAALDHLVDIQLLEPVAGGRYRLHDLVRLVAAERATAEDPESTRDEVLHLAIAYFAGALQRAEKVTRLGRDSSVVPPIEIWDLQLPGFLNGAEARSWVDAELPNMVIAFRHGIRMDIPTRAIAIRLGDLLWHSLDVRFEWQVARQLSRLARRLADGLGDAGMAAWSYLALGRSEATFGNYVSATRNLRSAIEAMQQTGNDIGAASALCALGTVSEWAGEASAAIHYYSQSLALARRYGWITLEAVTLLNLSSSLAACGKLDCSIEAAQKSLVLRRGQGDLVGIETSLLNVAILYCLEGNLVEADRSLHEALLICREVGDRLRENQVLLVHAEVALRRNDVVGAGDYVQAVLEKCLAVGDRYLYALALGQRVKVLVASGRNAEAMEVRRLAAAALQRVTAHRDTMLDQLLS
jgi:DNA-binding SARP family transcriptional activator